MKKFIALCLVGLYAQSAFSLEKEERIMPQGGIDKALLGQILFFDTSLSINSLQSFLLNFIMMKKFKIMWADNFGMVGRNI